MPPSARLKGFKFVLTLIGIYHLALGLLPFVPTDFAARLVSALFGMTIEVTPQLHYVARLMGAYALIFGVVTLIVASQPDRYRAFTPVILALYAVRIVNRILFVVQFMNAFQTTAFRAWLEVFLLAAFAVAVFLLRPREQVAG